MTELVIEHLQDLLTYRFSTRALQHTGEETGEGSVIAEFKKLIYGK